MQVLKIMLVVAVLSTAVLPLRDVLDLDTLRTPLPRWRWMRTWIVDSDRREIDYAFVGSSKTQTDVMPIELQRHIPGSSSINAGHYEFGHDADYFIAEALLRLHDVGTLVIEIPEKWNEAPHGRIGYLIGVSDLPGEFRLGLREIPLRSVLTYGQELKSIASRLTSFAAVAWLSLPAHVLDWVVTVIPGGEWDAVEGREELDRVLGYAGVEEQVPSFVRGAGSKPMPRFLMPREFSPNRFDRPAPGSRGDWYLRRIHALARRSDTKLAFAFMPSWRLALPTLEAVEYYEQFGEVLIPRLTELNHVQQYRDAQHLTTLGARRYTEELAKLLLAGAEASPYRRFYRALGNSSRGDRDAR